MLLVTLILILLINCGVISEENKDPFDMKINEQTTEVMRLFKLNAVGLLPQIFQRTPNEDNRNLRKKNNNLMKRLQQHALNWHM